MPQPKRIIDSLMTSPAMAFRFFSSLPSPRSTTFSRNKITAWESRYLGLFDWVLVLSTYIVQAPIYRLAEW
jgi:hypothetical protein